MPLRITLSDHDTVELTVPLEDWNRAYQKALKNGTMVEIEEPSGRIVSINPQRVLLLETVDPAAEPQPAGA
jgi:hypothetical protein